MAEEQSTAKIWRSKADYHPHACMDRLVYLTYTVYDETVGNEVERIEVVPCRRCAARLKYQQEEASK
jgi:hypothetical protein